jgi:methylmalonyl-CoA epimerase
VSTRVHHIGLAVTDLDQAVAYYRRNYGLRPAQEHVSVADGVREVLIPAGSCLIQLLEPTADTSPVARFLARHGPGLHHLALEVDHVDRHLSRLAAAGNRLVDSVPRPGTGGLQIAFVHPVDAFGVLTELVERDPARGST